MIICTYLYVRKHLIAILQWNFQKRKNSGDLTTCELLGLVFYFHKQVKPESEWKQRNFIELCPTKHLHAFQNAHLRRNEKRFKCSKQRVKRDAFRWRISTKIIHFRCRNVLIKTSRALSFHNFFISFFRHFSTADLNGSYAEIFRVFIIVNDDVLNTHNEMNYMKNYLRTGAKKHNRQDWISVANWRYFFFHNTRNS